MRTEAKARRLEYEKNYACSTGAVKPRDAISAKEEEPAVIVVSSRNAQRSLLHPRKYLNFIFRAMAPDFELIPVYFCSFYF